MESYHLKLKGSGVKRTISIKKKCVEVSYESPYPSATFHFDIVEKHKKYIYKMLLITLMATK